MDLPVKEAPLRANAHITHYHHLLALVQVEQFFELAGHRMAGLGPFRMLGAGRLHPNPGADTTNAPDSTPSLNRI